MPSIAKLSVMIHDEPSESDAMAMEVLSNFLEKNTTNDPEDAKKLLTSMIVVSVMAMSFLTNDDDTNQTVH